MPGQDLSTVEDSMVHINGHGTGNSELHLGNEDIGLVDSLV